MNRSTWQRAKEIFDEARGLSAEGRFDYIDRACGENDELRSQVQQLLASYESDFLEDTALGAVEVLAKPVLANGLVIGRYTIREMIGSGGMGQVFRAEDTELNRPVAFKVLHKDVAEDAERVRRFIQEAKAASALNHPNILTIHEIGSFEGARFIVSEFVDGETLRERMRRGLTVADSIEIICQIAAALHAAHAAGIVHRDIKPENVMIRRDGLVKVLDFGLAKLTEADDPMRDPLSPIPHSEIRNPHSTAPGLVMGTVAYMSPEQARGQSVDARTDLWSLGIVLHEMLTGKSPFEGTSATELITSILSTEGTPADVDSLPPELTPICKKALTKEKEKRYQSAHDLLEDLKGEKKRMEYAIQTTPFISTSNTDELKTQLIRPHRTLSAEYIVTSVKRHKYASLLTAAVIVFSGIGVSVYRFNGAPSSGNPNAISRVFDSSTNEADLRMSRFPASGKIAEVAISPDGKFVAYVTSDGPERNALRLRGRETPTDVEIVPSPSHGTIKNLSFSPDSTQVFYRHSFPPFTGNTLNRVSVSGGPVTKLVVDVESGGSLSPDGKMLAFNREVERRPGLGGGDAVIIANSDGSNERVLSHSGFDGPTWLYCGDVPSWSHDGKSLACETIFDSPQGRYSRLTTLNVNDRSTKLRDERWWDVSGSIFMPDGSLVIAAKPVSSERLSPSQLWLIAPNSPPKSLTSDLTGYSNLSSSRTGDILMTLQSRTLIDIWARPTEDSSRAKQITNSGDVVSTGWFTWTPDGKILFSSSISGNADIWMMNADGGGRKQLTSNHNSNRSPTISPDGRHIVFLSHVNNWDSHVFRMDVDGKNIKQLTRGWQERSPRISLDGKWVYFVQNFEEDVPMKLCKVSIDGGEPIVLATGTPGLLIQDVSPKDGSIVYEELSDINKGTRQVKIMDPSNPANVKTLQFDSLSTIGFLQWSSDGSYLTYLDRSNKTFDVIGGMAPNGHKLTKPLVTFATRVGLFSWSKDGKQLAYLRGSNTSDAVLISNKSN